MTVCNFLFAFGIKEVNKEENMKVGESRDYRIVNTLSPGWSRFRRRALKRGISKMC